VEGRIRPRRGVLALELTTVADQVLLHFDRLISTSVRRTRVRGQPELGAGVRLRHPPMAPALGRDQEGGHGPTSKDGDPLPAVRSVLAGVGGGFRHPGDARL
jgi:hypothetical protein